MARIERILFKLNVTARTDLKCGFLIARNISTQKSLINGNFILLKPEYKSQLEIRKKGPYDPFISLNRMKSISRNRRELHTLEYLENIHIEKSKEKFKINSKDKPINTPFDSQIAVPSQVIGELLIAEWKLNLNRGENLPTKLPISCLVYRSLELEKNKEMRAETIKSLLEYLHTDSISILDGDKEQQASQLMMWQPIVDRVSSLYLKSHKIMIRESTFSPDPQTNEVEHLIQQIMHQMTAFQLAGFELLVKTVKSILLGLYAFSVHDSQKIIDAALVDYDLQSKKWGSIEDFHTLNRLQMVETVNLCRIFLTSSNIFEKNNFQ